MVNKPTSLLAGSWYCDFFRRKVTKLSSLSRYRTPLFFFPPSRKQGAVLYKTMNGCCANLKAQESERRRRFVIAVFPLACLLRFYRVIHYWDKPQADPCKRWCAVDGLCAEPVKNNEITSGLLDSLWVNNKRTGSDSFLRLPLTHALQLIVIIATIFAFSFDPSEIISFRFSISREINFAHLALD